MASDDGQALRPSSANDPGKAKAASPRITSEEVELGNVRNGNQAPKIPLEEDIMQCARLGETGLIQKMFESGKYKPNYKDEEGITPLHVWNDFLQRFCRILMDRL